MKFRIEFKGLGWKRLQVIAIYNPTNLTGHFFSRASALYTPLYYINTASATNTTTTLLTYLVTLL